MPEILNSKRAGLYLNGEYTGYITDATVHISKDIHEHVQIGSDMKFYSEGVVQVNFSFSGIHMDDNKINNLSSGIMIYDTATSKIIPSALNNVQSEFALWQTTVGSGPTVNIIIDDSADADNYQAAQCFISPGTSLKSGKVSLNKVGSPTDQTLNWKIVNDNSDKPGGTTFISGTIAGGSLPESSTATWVDLGTPTNTTPLVPGTKYWLVLYFGAVNNGTPAANYFGWCHANANALATMVMPATKTSEQTTDQSSTKFATCTDNGTTWTVSGTYLDQTFLLDFYTDTNWNIAMRIAQADGTTVGWIVLNNCVFDEENKALDANNALTSKYTGKASIGKFQVAYTPLP